MSNPEQWSDDDVFRKMRTDFEDFYSVLGISREAAGDAAALKRAHRRAVRAAHPDKGGSEDAFHEVSRAFAVLSDGALRDFYDRTGRDPLESGLLGGGGADGGGGSLEEEALAGLRHLFAQYLNGSSMEFNVVGRMRMALEDSIEEDDGKLAKLESKLDGLRVKLARFDPKDSKTLLFVDVIGDAIRDSEFAMAQISHHRELSVVGLDLMEDWVDGFEEPEISRGGIYTWAASNVAPVKPGCIDRSDWRCPS